jgi:cell division septation protein DedD
MRGVFDEREFEPVEAQTETELTLGTTTLLLIAFGLVLLCGLCFGLGYAAGHRSEQPPVASLPSPDVPATADSSNGRPKPSANAQPAPAVTSADTESSNSADQPSLPSNVAAPAQQNHEPSPSTAQSNDSSQVKPALAAVITALPSGLPASSAVASAMPSAGSIMVQIAAVSQPEDADVLMSALRKHGYAVGARREPLDGLIHVRIGPFKSRDEAEKSRQKLLSDGYNAIVQP